MTDTTNLLTTREAEARLGVSRGHFNALYKGLGMKPKLITDRFWWTEDQIREIETKWKQRVARNMYKRRHGRYPDEHVTV